MSGIYAVYYTGHDGSGFALFMMKDGLITGADAEGGVLDGTYKNIGDGKINISVTLVAPVGASLVTGAFVDEGFISQQITNGVIPDNFDNGSIIPLQTTTGPVNAVFKRLRDIP